MLYPISYSKLEEDRTIWGDETSVSLPSFQLKIIAHIISCVQDDIQFYFDVDSIEQINDINDILEDMLSRLNYA